MLVRGPVDSGLYLRRVRFERLGGRPPALNARQGSPLRAGGAHPVAGLPFAALPRIPPPFLRSPGGLPDRANRSEGWPESRADGRRAGAGPVDSKLYLRRVRFERLGPQRCGLTKGNPGLLQRAKASRGRSQPPPCSSRRPGSPGARTVWPAFPLCASADPPQFLRSPAGCQTGPDRFGRWPESRGEDPGAQPYSSRRPDGVLRVWVSTSQSPWKMVTASPAAAPRVGGEIDDPGGRILGRGTGPGGSPAPLRREIRPAFFRHLADGADLHVRRHLPRGHGVDANVEGGEGCSRATRTSPRTPPLLDPYGREELPPITPAPGNYEQHYPLPPPSPSGERRTSAAGSCR